jgi:hypothetical protein
VLETACARVHTGAADAIDESAAPVAVHAMRLCALAAGMAARWAPHDREHPNGARTIEHPARRARAGGAPVAEERREGFPLVVSFHWQPQPSAG